MRAPHAPAEMQAAERREAAVATRLYGQGLILARVLWVAVVALALSLFVAAVPARYAYLLTFAGLGPGVTPDALQVGLTQVGLSIAVYAAYKVALTIIFGVVVLVIAAVLVGRRSDDWLALFVALTLVLMSTADTPTVQALVALYPAWSIPAMFALFLSFAALTLFFFVFPDGRFVPRWMRAPMLLWSAGLLIVCLHPAAWVDAANMVLLGGLGCGVVAQLYRYRRVSTPVQRQQTKWVVFGVAALFLGNLVMILPGLLVPAVTQPGLPVLLYDAANVTGLNLFFLLLPLTISMAVLRYRLWDIDVVINRALVYGTLTGLLLAVYLGGVVALQGLFRGLTGQESNLAIVVATLAAAALFQPLRRRLQSFIDRRFYRRKYDATRTLAAFSTHLRDEVDLAELSAELVRVVDETMQPAHASLWLRPPNATGRTILEGAGQPPETAVRRRPATSHPLARRAGE